MYYVGTFIYRRVQGNHNSRGLPFEVANDQK